MRHDAPQDVLARESAALERAVETIEAEIAAPQECLFGPAPPHVSQPSPEELEPPDHEAQGMSRLAFALAVLAVAAASGVLALRPTDTSGARIAALRSPAVAGPDHAPEREIAASVWRLGAARGAVRWFTGPDRFSLAPPGNREGVFARIDLAATGAPPLELRLSAAPDPALRATHAIEFAFAPPAPGGAMVSIIDMPRVRGGAPQGGAPADIAGVVIRTGAQTFAATFSARPEDALYNRALMRDATALSVVLRTDRGDALTLVIELPRAVAAALQPAGASLKPYAPAP